MREDSSGCNIKRDLVDRVQPGIGTKKPQAMRFSQGLGTSGLAGAEGLEPSARGFGVDVETNHGKQGKAGVARFSRTSPKRVVLVWCYGEIFRAKTGKKEREIPGKTGNALTKIDTGRIIKNAGQTTLG